MADLTVVIPARQETYPVVVAGTRHTVLQRTVVNAFQAAAGEVQVVVVQDGPPYQNLPPYKHLVDIRLDENRGTKVAINRGIEAADGRWVLKLDGHCSLPAEYDRVLLNWAQPNWITVPRFFVLDPDKWAWQDGRFYDYFMLPYPKMSRFGPYFQAGGHWHERTLEKLDIHPVDESMKIHGSAFFCSREFFLKDLGGLDPANGAGTWNGEDLELSLKTWLGPWEGRVMVNKGTWYAHMHRGGQRPREWPVDTKTAYRSAVWSTDFWLRNKWPGRVHDIDWLVDKFWPVPGWPENWRELWK